MGLSLEPDVASLIIENVTRGTAFTQHFMPSDPNNLAIRDTASWVVERPPGINLMNFGIILWTRCSASYDTGVLGVSGASPISMQSSDTNNTIIAVGSIVDDSTISVAYTGP